MLIFMELGVVAQSSASFCSTKLEQNYFILSRRMRWGKREKKKKCLITSRTLKLTAKYNFIDRFKFPYAVLYS